MPSKKNIALQLIPMQVLAIVLFALLAWFLVPFYLAESVKENATTAALQTAQQFKTLRAYYTDNVVKKILNTKSDIQLSHEHTSLANAIPLPASLIHDMSSLVNENNHDLTIRFYSPLPFKNRQDRKMDQFGEAAWQKLKANPQHPYVQHSRIDGREVIRVAVSDTMLQQVCIDCHNSHPLSPKRDWQLGDLRGVLEISTDISSLINSGKKTGRYLALALITFFGLIFTITFRRTFSEIKFWSKELSAREQKLATNVFNTMSQGVVVTDRDNHIISINLATSKITGYTIEEVAGKNPKIFSSGNQDSDFYASMWRSLTSSGYWEGEIWGKHKNGKLQLHWMTISVIYDKQGEVSQFVSIFSDITERKRTDELIWKQANYDLLTGLANRTLFHKQVQHELNRCQRNKSEIAVIYLDLDGFKDVNDSLGHAAGDKLLIEVAQRLQRYTRKTDTIARLGGDEFTLLLTDIQKPEQVGSVAKNILGLLAEPIVILEREIHIGASLGIALYPGDGTSQEELAKHADVAMYQAKMSGKNQFQFFQQEMKTKALHRLSLIHDLHIALESKAFFLYYQPKIRLSDGKVIGSEALIRWFKSDGQLISPVDFIPCAEETGLIIPIGDWVLTEACRQTEAWNQQFDTQLHVAVNLSARQFRVDNIVGNILATLDQQSFPAHLLELEITESILMDNVEEAIEVMAKLRKQGVSIAIDDFGTGYSSLSHLKRFPINTLKIDRSFICDLTEESKDAAIVHSILSLAESLDLVVVAEGVETIEQLSFLEQKDCFAAQGYYMAKPMPPEEFEAFLLKNGGTYNKP
jgi:diguanylate cyclase (GGDEF)-like protein/PAS domain S-box-containing protein